MFRTPARTYGRFSPWGRLAAWRDRYEVVIDKLIDDASNEADAAKQLDLLKKANNLLQDEAPVWFFNYNKAVMAYQPWLHGLQPNATELALQRYEDLWVDASSPAAK